MMIDTCLQKAVFSKDRLNSILSTSFYTSHILLSPYFSIFFGTKKLIIITLLLKKSSVVGATLLYYYYYSDLSKRFLSNLGSVREYFKLIIILRNFLPTSLGVIGGYIFELLTKSLRVFLYLLEITKIAVLLFGPPNICLITCFERIFIIRL